MESPRTPVCVAKVATRADFERLLQTEHGLDPSFDPRIKQALDERLGDMKVLDEADIRAFSKSSALLSRALRSRLIVPNYKEFSNALEEAFEEAIGARSPDAANKGLGENAAYIPPLKLVDPDQRIVFVCTTDGQFWSRYDGNCSEKTRFTAQSVSKVFTYAIALETSGEKAVHEEVGREPSGRSFNELTLTSAGKPHNPYINSGAIRTAGMVFPGLSRAEKFDRVQQIWEELFLEGISFANDVFLAERDTADKNFALAYMMRETKCLPADCDIKDLISIYLSFCSLEVSCRGLSVAAATLANGGVNPFSGKRVFSEKTVRNCLSLMASCGMYDGSGAFQLRIGIPAKSGVSGALLCVVPWRFGFATFSPRLDRAGNSVFGVEFCRALAPRVEKLNLGLPLFESSSRLPTLNLRRMQTLFLHACARGDLIRVRELVARGCPFQRGDYDGRTGLHVCTDTATRSFLLKIGLDPMAVDRFGNIAAVNPIIHESSSEDEGTYQSSSTITAPGTPLERLNTRDHMMDLFLMETSQQTPPPSEPINIDSIMLSIDKSFKSIPTRLERLGLSPTGRFYNRDLPLDKQHPSVLKALQGSLAIPDWPNFVKSFEELCAEVEALPCDRASAQYCHTLGSVDLKEFGAAVTTIDGQTLIRGNAALKKVSMQSVFKPFAYAIALQSLGFEAVEKRVSCEPSGRSFRDMSLDSKGRPFNPMVNAGGLVTSSLIFKDAASQADRYNGFVNILKRCGIPESSYEFSQAMFLGEMEGAYNRVMAIAHVLQGSGALEGAIEKAVEIYFTLCSILLNVEQASALAACLANGGRNPFTQEQLFSEEVTRRVITVMMSSGLAEHSGTHSFTVGFPAKSGVSGLTIGVVNGVCGFAVYSPGLDDYGNSYKANVFFEKLAERYRVHIFEMNLLSRRYTQGISLSRYAYDNEALIVGDLLFAASRGDIWLVKELLARKVVDVNTCDYDGRSALHLAASEGRLEVVKVLLEAGANPVAEDKFGGTAASDAIRFGHDEVAALLAKAANGFNVMSLARAHSSGVSGLFSL